MSEPEKEKAATITRAMQWYMKVVVSPEVSPTLAAKTPVASMPTMPPTPWQGKTSRVSSRVDFVRRLTARLLMTLATRPMTMLWGIVTKPAAGVMATSPTTAPMQAPRAEGFLPIIQSKNIQPSIAVADAVLVVANAMAAVPLAASAEPALKPNQPNQSIPVPSRTNGMFAGS